MKKQTAIIFDIDGTAIDSPRQKLPTTRLIRAVRGLEDSHYLCAATGRAWSFAKPVLQGLGLSDPSIISGGTQICNPLTGEILWECDIEPTNLEAVIAAAKRFPEQKILFNDCTDDDYFHGGFSPNDLDISGPVYMFNVKLVPQDIAPAIVESLSHIKGVACTKILAQIPGYNDIHITNHRATKEHAIAELLKMLNIKTKDTIGVGDGHNDLHLFSGVAHTVAMSNSVDELKAAADEIIGNVSEDGFAAYLESLA